MTARLAAFGEKIGVVSNGGNWLVTCCPPAPVPEGTPHGANAWCVTPEGAVVLVSPDGERWGWPGGRPEAGETWEQTLHREMKEEACVTVQRATCLGFTRGRCLDGRQAGTVLVRSIWRAEVTVMEWRTEFEITDRKLVAAGVLRDSLWMEPGFEPLYERWLSEAGLSHS